MEYFDLGDLHHCLSEMGSLPELAAQIITSQILEGIFFMHDNDFVHSDLKPQVRFTSTELKKKPTDLLSRTFSSNPNRPTHGG
jgi:serine/threonine protein kinase